MKITAADYLARQAANMKERGRGGLQERVRLLCKRLGVLHYHTFDSRKSTPGFPDSIILPGLRGPVIVAELKTEKGKVTEDQERWLEAFRQVPGVEVYVWRPSDLLSGEIELIIRGVPRQGG